MGALADAVLLAAVAVGSVRCAHTMLRVTWPRRSPATAILLWQALGLAGGLAAVGALLAIGVSGPGAQAGVLGGLTVLAPRLASGELLAPHQPVLLTAARLVALTAGFALFTVLCWMLVLAFANAVGARRRQRELLALLAHGDPKVPGALVIDYPAAAAYCLPGIRSQIVVSAGTLALLAPAELTAVLAHERAHLRARHDLVLIPFTSLRRVFPRSRVIAQAYRTVALLVEMMADDHALRVRGLLARELATALLRFGMSGSECTPAGALAVAEGELTARVSRILTPQPPLPRAAQAAVVLAAAALVAIPLLLLVVPSLWLPGAVGAGVGVVVVLLELADPGPHVRQVDPSGDERDDGQEADGPAVGGRVEPDRERDAEDEQPLHLGQLARRKVRVRRPHDGVDECPGLKAERRDRKRHEEVVERTVCTAY